jgi:hypothetical protein
MKMYQRIISTRIIDYWSIVSVSSLEKKSISNRYIKKSKIKFYQNDLSIKYKITDGRSYDLSDLHTWVSCTSTFGFLRQKTGSTIK